MNSRFPIHTPDDAPEDAREFLRHTQANFGMIPNLEGVMAAAPSLLKSYVGMWDEFEKTSLTAIERQVVYQTANFENTCNYCVPWHTLLSEMAGMAAGDISALRDGRPLTDSKLEALRQFTKELIVQRGKISVGARDAFFAAGYTSRQALEVIMGVAIKTLSNFTNSVAATPLDAAVQNLAWCKPLTDR